MSIQKNNHSVQQLELAIVMPVYNEEDCICAVIEGWLKELEKFSVSAQIIAINDGSTDSSLIQLQRLANEDSRIYVLDKANEGHGPSILQGYHKAVKTAKWVFQIDSDNELRASDFSLMWNMKDDYDFLFCIRTGRVQSLGRSFISWISRMLVLFFCGAGVDDVNAPFRLMRSSELSKIIESIPCKTFAPNVAISGLAIKHNCRIANVSITCHPRQTGCCSLVKWQLVRSSIKACIQTANIFMGAK